MTKRMIAWALALVMIFTLLPGNASAAEDIALTLMVDPVDYEWVYQQLAAFEDENPKWDITWDILCCSPGDVSNFIVADPTASADVFFYTSDSRYQLQRVGALLPLTDSDAAKAKKLTSQTLMNTLVDEDGLYYGIPLSGNTWFLYYDKRVFSEEDVKSLETMLTKGKVAFPLTNNWYLPSFYFANGGTMFGTYGIQASHGIRFNGAKGAAVTLRLAELVEEPNFYIDVYYDGSYVLVDGKANAFFSGSWDYENAYRFLGENLGAAQLPTVTIDGQPKQLKSFLGCTAVGVNAYTDHTEAARALAMFLASEESQLLRWEMTGAFPAASTLVNDPAIASNVAVKAQIDTQRYTSTPQPSVAEMRHYWDCAASMSDWLLNGEITPENAAKRTEKWNALLNGGENPPPFTDVPADSFYYAPVMWAIEKGITNGLTDTEFGPTATCNRAQVVTFLWRAAGSPEPTSTENPFVDVQAGSFYESAVLWAVEKGITNGSDATHFGPNGVCNRAQVVTFLYRAFESPAVSTDGLPFTDVPAGAWYEAPIAWAVENEITNGISATEFGPNASCNRAQVVTFLYRAYND